MRSERLKCINFNFGKRFVENRVRYILDIKSLSLKSSLIGLNLFNTSNVDGSNPFEEFLIKEEF